MIAAEGPTVETQNSFWKMIMQENVTKVFSLCDDSDVCRYFPKSSNYPMYKKDDDVDYMIFLGEVKSGTNYTKRHLEIHMKPKKTPKSTRKDQKEIVHKVEHI